MSDFMKNLPLSQRARGDESAVASDRRPEFDEVVARVQAEASTLAGPAGPGLPDQAAAPLAELDRLAAAAARKRSVSAGLLTSAVIAGLDFGRAAGIPAMIPTRTCGIVALVLAAKAPTAIRAVISGHALRASDADWEFGRGPVLEATAVELVEFLAGRSLQAPKPAPRERPAPPAESAPPAPPLD